MSKAAKVENYYDLLKVSPESSFADIHAAYQTARSAFSKDSSATYSLFSPQETKEILEKLDQAYFTLSSVEKRTEYNKSMGIAVEIQADAKTPRAPGESRRDEVHVIKAESAPTVEKTISNDAFEVGPDAIINGALLIAAREKKGLTLDDVARITKIPMRVLKAIESDDSGKFPAKVYLQGFVKNLCHLYKIDAKDFVAKYLSFAETLSPTTSLK